MNNDVLISDDPENHGPDHMHDITPEMYQENLQQSNYDFVDVKESVTECKSHIYSNIQNSESSNISISMAQRSMTQSTISLSKSLLRLPIESSKTVPCETPAMSSQIPTLTQSDAPILPMSSAEFQQAILLEFKKLHHRLNHLSDEIIPELRTLSQRIARIENQCKTKGTGMPCRPTCLPIKSDQDLDTFERLPEDEYDEVVRYFEFVTGFNVKETVNNIMKEAVLDQYAMDLTWHGKNDKTPFINTRLSRAIFEALSKNKFFETPNSKEFQCAVTEALRNSKQRVRNKKEVVTPGHENRKRSYIKIKEEYG